MNNAQITTAKIKIRKHYNLNRSVTDEEFHAELANMARRERQGTLDDNYQMLYNSLCFGRNPLSPADFEKA